MKEQGRTPLEQDTKKAEDAMHRAVDRTIEEKKHEPLGSEQAKRQVAEDLKDAAEKDAGSKSTR